MKILEYMLEIYVPSGIITDFIKSFPDLINNFYSEENNYFERLQLFDDLSLQKFTELNNAFHSIGINRSMIDFRDLYESKLTQLSEDYMNTHLILKSIANLYVNTKHYFKEELDLTKLDEVDLDLLKNYMEDNYFIPEVDWVHFL